MKEGKVEDSEDPLLDDGGSRCGKWLKPLQEKDVHNVEVDGKLLQEREICDVGDSRKATIGVGKSKKEGSAEQEFSDYGMTVRTLRYC